MKKTRGRERACDSFDRESLAWVQQSGAKQALDIGAGKHAKMSQRLAAVGLKVAAIDIERIEVTDPNIQTYQCDLNNFTWNRLPKVLDVVISQRCLHYLRYNQALQVLGHVVTQMSKGARLFVTLSGIESELSQGYQPVKIDRRFAKLSRKMQRKHQIKEPVCLYTVEETETLARVLGLKVVSCELSSFGNVRLIAQK